MSSAPENDEWLMVQVRAGKQERLETLVRRHATPLLTFIRRMVGDVHHEVVIRPEGDLEMMYQVVARHHEKWAAPPPKRPGLDLAVNYDRKELTTAEVLHARVTLRYNGTAPAHMVMIDLGIPPGFVPDPDTFDGLVRTGAVQRYSITARQITLYLNGVQPNAGLSFEYALKARFPIKAKTPASVAYEYYVPTNRATVPPIELTVRAAN